MPFLKLSRNHVDTDKIANVITPKPQEDQESVVVLRYSWGAEETFYGDDAEKLRQWLASQLDPPRPVSVPFVQTKSEPAPSNKSAPRR